MEVKVLTQGKESAEKQIKSMGYQMAMSLDSYKKGYDDILTRKEKEFDERMQLVNKQVMIHQLIMQCDSYTFYWVFCFSLYVPFYGILQGRNEM